jgi:hypothetical protein
VEWDAGSRCRYRYGVDASYDIVVCDSPRVLLDEMIAVGCLVTRGKEKNSDSTEENNYSQ